MKGSEIGELAQRGLNVFVDNRCRDEAVAAVNDAMPYSVGLSQAAAERVTHRGLVDARNIRIELVRRDHPIIRAEQCQLE